MSIDKNRIYVLEQEIESLERQLERKRKLIEKLADAYDELFRRYIHIHGDFVTCLQHQGIVVDP